MRRIVAATACLAAVLAAPPPAGAAQCGLPDRTPLAIDYAGTGVTFAADVFGRPGIVGAVTGRTNAQALAARGAQAIFWEMNFRNIVGLPTTPADPAKVVPAADALFNRAASATGCATPLIALNELEAPTLAFPGGPRLDQYRANVLTAIGQLATRGARPFLLVPSNPNVADQAAAWWGEVAKRADVVREVYFNAPAIVAQGPLLGSRAMRVGMRRAVQTLTAIGIPASRLGIMLGFQSGGLFGRAGALLPAWLEYVKLHTLAAQQVAAETGVATVWSWGWGTFGPASADPDKPLAACVYLWTRDPSLCDAPTTAGANLNADRAEGQIALPQSVHCSFGPGLTIVKGSVERLTRLTHDRKLALSALLTRLVWRAQAPTRAPQVVRTEREIVRVRFGGRRAAYLRALAREGLTLDVARGILADELSRSSLGRRMSAAALTTSTIQQEQRLLETATCAGDELPEPTLVRLARFARFLALPVR